MIIVAVGGEPENLRIVLYDDDCAFCKWSLDKILAWDRRGVLRPVAIQSEEGQALLASVPEGERLDSWHLVLSSGEVRSAGAAAAPLADVLPGARPLAMLFRAYPGATDRAYKLVARNRNRLARILRIDATCGLRR